MTDNFPDMRKLHHGAKVDLKDDSLSTFSRESDCNTGYIRFTVAFDSFLLFSPRISAQKCFFF